MQLWDDLCSDANECKSRFLDKCISFLGFLLQGHQYNIYLIYDDLHIITVSIFLAQSLLFLTLDAVHIIWKLGIYKYRSRTNDLNIFSVNKVLDKV